MKNVYFLFVCASLIWQNGSAQNPSPSTIGEIYNFDVGDTFEYAVTTYSIDGQYGCNSQGWEMRIIISKEESLGSITYNYRRNSTNVWNCNYQYGGSGSGSDTSQLTVTQLDSSIFWYDTYRPLGCDTSACYLDTVYVDSSMNNLKVNAHSVGAWNFNADTAYADGVGLAWEGFGSEDFEEQQGDESLIYYHKTNGQSWGTLVDFIVTGINSIGNELSMRIFPNPVTTSFHLALSELPPQSTYFQLFDALGRLVNEEKITETNSNVRRNTLTNGIYFWQLESNGQILNRGKIIFE